MKIDFDMLEKLAASGATAQVIIEVLKAQDGKKSAKRARDKKRQRAIQERKKATKSEMERDQAISPPIAETPSQIAERELFNVAKQAMGKKCGGLVSSLVRHHNYDLAAARRVIDIAVSKSDPREYVVASMRSTKNGAGNPTMAAFDDLIARAEGDEVERDPKVVDITPSRSQGR